MGRRSCARVPLCLLLLAAAVAPAVWLGGCAENNDDDEIVNPPQEELTFIGSAACAFCHAAQVAEAEQSGHAHVLTPVSGNQPPADPTLELPASLAPAGLDWNDLSYVVGGYGWTTNFVKTDGYVHQHPSAGQHAVSFDFPDSQLWVPYETGAAQQPYDCGFCHATGWRSSAENGNRHQDNRPGIAGTWVEPGVRCERCHGPGSRHAATGGDPAWINRDRRPDLICEECHQAEDPAQPVWRDGFIAKYQQREELDVGEHRSLDCVECHDPHRGVIQDEPDGSGIVRACQACHGTVEVDHPVQECRACHMPRASKIAFQVSEHRADLRTHIFKIRSQPEGKETMLEDAGGGTVVKNDWGVTLDYVCYQCHSEESYTLQELAAFADGIHERIDDDAGGARAVPR